MEKEKKQIRAIDAANGMTYIGEDDTNHTIGVLLNYLTIDTRVLYKDLSEGPDARISQLYRNCTQRGKCVVVRREGAIVEHSPITIDDAVNSDKK